VYAHQTNTQPVIDFEKNENLKGLHYLDELHKHIINKQSLKITYQSFKTRYPNTFYFFPYLLKEFRNRWFVVGRRKKGKPLVNLALDRIIKIEEADVKFIPNDIDLEAYYKVAIGVSVEPHLKTEKVRLFVSRKLAPYVETKPLHHSQKTVERNHFGIVIELDIQHNFELEKEILGFGEEVRVMAPERLKQSILKRLKTAVNYYETDIHLKKIENSLGYLRYSGCVIVNHFYPKRTIRQLNKAIHNIIVKDNNDEIKILDLIKYPHIFELLNNPNMMKLAETSGQTIKSIIFYPKPESRQNAWHQRVEFQGNETIVHLYLSERNEHLNKMKVYNGSFHRLLSEGQIDLITRTTPAQDCKPDFGGIILFQPQILQKLLLNTDKGSAFIELILE